MFGKAPEIPASVRQFLSGPGIDARFDSLTIGFLPVINQGQSVCRQLLRLQFHMVEDRVGVNLQRGEIDMPGPDGRFAGGARDLYEGPRQRLFGEAR